MNGRYLNLSLIEKRYFFVQNSEIGAVILRFRSCDEILPIRVSTLGIYLSTPPGLSGPSGTSKQVSNYWQNSRHNQQKVFQEVVPRLNSKVIVTLTCKGSTWMSRRALRRWGQRRQRRRWRWYRPWRLGWLTSWSALKVNTMIKNCD